MIASAHRRDTFSLLDFSILSARLSGMPDMNAIERWTRGPHMTVRGFDKLAAVTAPKAATSPRAETSNSSIRT